MKYTLQKFFTANPSSREGPYKLLKKAKFSTTDAALSAVVDWAAKEGAVYDLPVLKKNFDEDMRKSGGLDIAEFWLTKNLFLHLRIGNDNQDGEETDADEVGFVDETVANAVRFADEKYAEVQKRACALAKKQESLPLTNLRKMTEEEIGAIVLPMFRELDAIDSFVGTVCSRLYNMAVLSDNGIIDDISDSFYDSTESLTEDVHSNAYLLLELALIFGYCPSVVKEHQRFQQCSKLQRIERTQHCRVRNKKEGMSEYELAKELISRFCKATGSPEMFHVRPRDKRMYQQLRKAWKDFFGKMPK